MDASELKRTWVDVYGRPQTVLKIAFLTSVEVRQRSLPIETKHRESADVCRRPRTSASLAVYLAVMAGTPASDLGSRSWLVPANDDLSADNTLNPAGAG